ncbi:unnamed protein product [Lampetra planeri]
MHGRLRTSSGPGACGGAWALPLPWASAEARNERPSGAVERGGPALRMARSRRSASGRSTPNGGFARDGDVVVKPVEMKAGPDKDVAVCLTAAPRVAPREEGAQPLGYLVPRWSKSQGTSLWADDARSGAGDRILRLLLQCNDAWGSFVNMRLHLEIPYRCWELEEVVFGLGEADE